MCLDRWEIAGGGELGKAVAEVAYTWENKTLLNTDRSVFVLKGGAYS